MLIDVSSFFQDNLYWLIPVLALLLAGIVLLFVFLLRAKKKPKEKAPELAAQSEYLAALGGAENIREKSIVGSRISIKLADFEKADPKKLLEIGVSSYIKMSGKLVLVCKDNAQAVYDRIFA